MWIKRDAAADADATVAVASRGDARHQMRHLGHAIENLLGETVAGVDCNLYEVEADGREPLALTGMLVLPRKCCDLGIKARHLLVWDREQE
jgi:hypothetical protein